MIEFEPLEVIRASRSARNDRIRATPSTRNDRIQATPSNSRRWKKRFMTAVVVLPVSRIGIPRRTGTYFSLPGVSRSFLTLFVRQNGELPLVAENCNIAGMHTRGG